MTKKRILPLGFIDRATDDGAIIMLTKPSESHTIRPETPVTLQVRSAGEPRATARARGMITRVGYVTATCKIIETRMNSKWPKDEAVMRRGTEVVLEDPNIKLASVVTDVRGVSSRAILEALIVGETDPTSLAELARGRMRTKRDLLARAVAGRFTPHHAFLISEQLGHLDHLEEAMGRVSDEIGRRTAEVKSVGRRFDNHAP